MHDTQQIPGADIQPPPPTGRVVKIVGSSLLVLVALSLGWLALQLFLASVV